MADERWYMGFYIGHLHTAERQRIREGSLNPHEREKLNSGQDPWEHLRNPLPPDLLPPTEEQQPPEQPPPKAEGVEISKFIEAFEDEAEKNPDAKPDLETLRQQLQSFSGTESIEATLARIQNQLREMVSEPERRLADSLRQLKERMEEDQRKANERLLESLKPQEVHWSKFVKDAETGRTRINPADEDEFRPDWTEFAKQQEEQREADEKKRLAGIEKAFDNALRRAESRAQTEQEMRGMYKRLGFTPIDELPPEQPQPERSRARRLYEWIKRNPFVAALIGFLLWNFPIGVATVWPVLVRDKTIPEWIAERRWPGVTPYVYGWLTVIFFVTLVILATVVTLIRRNEKK